MATLTITTRQTKNGPRYVVRFRLGGRAYPLEHAGSFKTMREARTRRDLVAGELAVGRNPIQALRAMLEPAAPRRTLADWSEKYLASRIDVAPSSARTYRSALRKASDRFGDRDPATIAPDDIAGRIGDLAAERKPATVHLYVMELPALLDYAGVDPNPVRDSRVKLPRNVKDEPAPPSAEHVAAIFEALPERWRLLFITIEQGGLRLGEAVSLTWGDVDAANLRLRLPRSRTKSGRGRWVNLPEWVVNAIERTCPLEDRVPDRRVFGGLIEGSAYQAMTRACRNAKVPHYSRIRSVTAGSQSGISRACRHGSSPSELGTPARR